MPSAVVAEVDDGEREQRHDEIVREHELVLVETIAQSNAQNASFRRCSRSTWGRSCSPPCTASAAPHSPACQRECRNVLGGGVCQPVQRRATAATPSTVFLSICRATE